MQCCFQLESGAKGPAVSSFQESRRVIQRQTTSVSLAVLWVAKGDVENWLVEIRSCETSLSPFSNEFPDHQMCSQF